MKSRGDRRKILEPVRITRRPPRAAVHISPSSRSTTEARMRSLTTALLAPVLLLSAGAIAHSASPAALAAQGLSDFDYENLSFRGIGFENGYIFGSRIDATPTFGMRVDMGYLGPGIRLVPGVTYWSSYLSSREVGRLENQVRTLIERETGEPVVVNLGEISWSDVIVSLDGHLVFSLPADLLTYTGLGFSAHVMSGGGEAIQGTFVQDLLGSVTAGINAHTGLEYTFDRARIYGVGRYEVLSNLRYAEIRIGAAIMFGGPAAGEVRGGRE